MYLPKFSLPKKELVLNMLVTLMAHHTSLFVTLMAHHTSLFVTLMAHHTSL